MHIANESQAHFRPRSACWNTFSIVFHHFFSGPDWNGDFWWLSGPRFCLLVSIPLARRPKVKNITKKKQKQANSLHTKAFCTLRKNTFSYFCGLPLARRPRSPRQKNTYSQKAHTNKLYWWLSWLFGLSFFTFPLAHTPRPWKQNTKEMKIQALRRLFWHFPI